MKDIIQRDAAILRAKAKPIAIHEIDSERIRKIIKNMKEAMHSQKDGVAIAAPQIGEPLQIFVVSGALLKKADKRYNGDDSDLIFINPRMVKISREKREVEEGCLSVRWLYGKVRRSVRATINAYNEKGEKITRGASGILAQIFQHECDHLNGILFTDKAVDVWEMSPEEIAELGGKE